MPTKQSDILSEDDFEELLAQLGGVETLRYDPNDFCKAVNRLWAECEMLTGTHPHKWVSMGKDGVVAIGDSIEEVRVDSGRGRIVR